MVHVHVTHVLTFFITWAYTFSIIIAAAGTRKRSGCGDCQGCGYRATGLWHRDTHIMLFKVPIMLCSNSQHQINYAHCFVPIMLLVLSIFLYFETNFIRKFVPYESFIS